MGVDEPQIGRVSAPGGPKLERFDAQQLAEAIEHEIIRAGDHGWTKVSINMELIDAIAMARFLRRGR